ncbi:hypothetical protein ACWIUD_11580 [Helicobacter sp. 23-1044]
MNRRICLNFSSLRDLTKSNRGNPQLNQSCDSTDSRPLRGAKNREQGASQCNRRFFARSGKSESPPPKSEKAAAFWGHN